MEPRIDKFDEEYRQMVARYIRDNNPAVFHNETIKHAKDIIVQFLDTAELSVEIMTGTMAEVFYFDPQLQDAFRRAALRLGENAIKIITINAPKEDVERIREITRKLNENASKHTIEYRPAKYNGQADKLRHIMLVDEKRYRWEFPHPQFSDVPQNVSAEVSCFAPQVVAERKEFFNKLWNLLGGVPVGA